MNLPVALVLIVGALIALPASTPRAESGPAHRGLLRRLDPLGCALFALAAGTIVPVVLGDTGALALPLVAVGLAALIAFVVQEVRVRSPLIDLRLIGGNPVLGLVYVAFALFNAVYYLSFFGLPQLLQDAAGYPALVAGALLLPLAASMMIGSPVAARLIERRGSAAAMRIGAAAMLVGVALTVVFVWTTWWPVVIVVAAAIGLPGCLLSLASTQAMHRAAPPERTGSASGVLQAARYIGAIGATVTIGLAAPSSVGPSQWLVLVAVAVALAAVLLVVVLLRPRSAPVAGAEPEPGS